MATYVIQDTVSKAIKKSLIKWGEFPIDNGGIRGAVTIKNYRQYMFRNEVDIEFKGEIFVELTTCEGRIWCGSDILTCEKYDISKIKLNRYLKKLALKEVCIRMNYFGVDIKEYRDINKIKWI
jgi:hypothetical protein